MSWPAVIAIAWPALSLAACALWARHRSREKRRQEIRQALRLISQQRAKEARLERDRDLALAARQRLITSINHFPRQLGKEDQP